MSPAQLTALNAAGQALRDLELGAVRLRYRPADHLIPRDTFTLWIEGVPNRGDVIGCGDTPDEALADAMAKIELVREAA